MKHQILTFVLLLSSATIVSAQETPPPRPIASLGFEMGFNGYQGDNGDQYRFGAGALNFGFRLNGEFSRRGRPQWSGTPFLFNQRIATSRLPDSVLLRAHERDIPTDRASLRIQKFWAVRAGAFPLRDLEIGYRFQVDNWRYDDLSRGARTTIPYIKGTQSAHLFFLAYRPALRGRFRFSAEAMAGTGTSDFRDGEERYLGDNDTNIIGSASGTLLGYSLSLGYQVGKNTDMMLTWREQTTSGANLNIYNRTVSLGVRLYTD